MILIGGGSRSGKTGLALQKARGHGARLAYVATAEALDEEMRQRAAAHQSERGAQFTTIEEPLDLAALVESRGNEFDAIVIDCLTVWLSNLMLGEHGEHEVDRAIEGFLSAVSGSAATIICVTNEVGSGIVPESALARRFRDRAGWLNQQIAAASDEVYWTVFGCPVKVK
jgi:adenosylcobinamide kinase/adenosylcobinamide-phosphate guanylyltransferase